MGTNHIIDLEPVSDPATGHVIFQTPPAAVDAPPVVDAGQLRGEGTDNAVALTDERFAADHGVDWAGAERAQDAGHTLQIVDGQLVSTGGKPASPGESVVLTNERFAASVQENKQISRLVRSGTASKLIADLQPTSRIRSHLPHDPGGWYLRTKPTPSFGDVLHTVIVRRSATGLYHAHLWRFMQNDRGELKTVELNRWVGAHASLSAHNVHLYPGQGGDAAVLCLSQRTTGGMPDLTGTVMQSAKWADGMGYVVRGRSFPYRQ
jgi:hypothetical protein